MRATGLIFILWVSAFLVGCGNEGKTGKQYGTSADKSEVFKLTVDLIIEKNDHLSLYYTTDGTTNFYTIKPIWLSIAGNKQMQQAVFSLPKKVHPSQLRLDLGKNPQQTDIFLKKITMSYKGKMVELPGTLIFSYFMADVSKTEINAKTGMVRGIVKNGVRQSPSLYPKERPLSEEIDRLIE